MTGPVTGVLGPGDRGDEKCKVVAVGLELAEPHESVAADLPDLAIDQRQCVELLPFDDFSGVGAREGARISPQIATQDLVMNVGALPPDESGVGRIVAS